jgi:phosphoribosylformylglycinamidine synthase
VIRVYDHEVQGGSVVKPLCGPGAGPSDAAVLRPRLDSYRAVALGLGLAPHLSDYDPYLMAVAAVDEALRNAICVGADPNRTAILDNFCWGGVDDPHALGALVRACQGAHDAAVAYGLPFISGKDSLNNQFTQTAAEARRCGLPERISIPGTLLISALGIVEEARRCVTADLKRPGNRIAIASRPAERFGLEQARKLHQTVADAIRRGAIAAAHDVSDGGLTTALAEMSIAGGLGMRVDVSALASGYELEETLFGEPLTTYVLELHDSASAWQLPLAWTIIGEVTQEPQLVILQGREVLVGLSIADLAAAHQHAMDL